ncbi:MAG TPA: MBL fold metallo-hydrolase [Solirubrobacteraceae bacterium]|nr:MBL fold metallo-hydrolase [Solirubrobacteraceae bacterium]
MEPAQIIDVRYGGRERAVGAWLAGDALIDCGPQACTPELLRGLAGRRPRRLLLTHIHFDHAGAAGELVRRWPDLEVWVHPRGARHLVDPARLVASARRVYGASFERLVGDVIPVPAANIKLIDDGAEVAGYRSAWTPGHAWHHVAFHDPGSGDCFPGDIAGVCLAPGIVIPPTPPPDIDLDAWRSSLGVVERWQPARLLLPHFGAVDDAAAHFALIREALDRHEMWAREGEEAFVAKLASWLGERLPPRGADDYSSVALAGPSAAGLSRWLAAARS